uniref:protein piccolo isoform X2 n=1 Tax=Gasterosteus aculeatus aculeatus TaxID=481459 RepID=UPI001A99EE8A|nr:protein piccolo isoform X2 [Gasterosteus aculeatus aculeatus]
MKPDGVALVALEPMETMESNPANEAAGQEPNQAASPAEGEMPQQPAAEMDQAEPKPDPAKDTPAAKTTNKTSGDSKAHPTNKATAKTKPGPTGSTKTTLGSRPNTSQSRLSNGVSKPQTNGVAKKTVPAAVNKSAAAPAKKPTAPAAKSKLGEKKPTGNDAKPMTGTTTTTTAAAKKTAPATAAGVKSGTAAAAAKKPPVSKAASATPTKPSAAAPPKPFVAKTTRPTPGTPTSSRPVTTRPPTSSTAKSSPAAAKTTPLKTSTAKPAAARPTSTTPSGGKPPALQTSRNTTPVKKDVTKPGTSAPKKPADSPLPLSSSKTKSAKPETPKSASKPDTAAKKPAPGKATDTKTPSRAKTDTKPLPARDTPRTPGSKAAASKTATPKKTVGSSTPTPVKRGPKAANVAEPVKEIAAAVAAAAAIATAAAAVAGPEEPEPPAAELLSSPTGAVQEHLPAPEPVTSPVREPTPEPVTSPVREPTPEPVTLPVREPTPEPVREPTPEPVTLPVWEPTPEPVTLPVREPTPEPVREPTPEPVTLPVRQPTPEPIRILTPEPVALPVREPTPEPVSLPVREPTPEPIRILTPELVREPSPDQAWVPSPEPLPEPLSQPESDHGAELVNEPASDALLSPQMDHFKFEESAKESVPCLGTTVMSPPCSPPGAVSPVREPQSASSLLDMNIQPDLWGEHQALGPSDFAPQSLVNTMNFYAEEEKEDKKQFEEEEDDDEEVVVVEEEKEEEKENLFMPTAAAPSATAFNMMASPMRDLTPRDLISPQDKEEAVEKADEEINYDDDEEEEEEDYEDEEQRRLGHQPSSLVTDMSTSQPSEELQVRPSAFGVSAAWHADDPLSGMDSEDVSSCTSSRQQGVSDLSSTQHTALLEGTQSSDALVDSSLRGSEGDGNLMGSPNVETLANEEEEDEEDEERVDDMDLSSERVEEHHKAFQQQERDEDEEDEDVEMHSEGVTESCGNVDEEDFHEEERLDNLNRSGAPQCASPASSWSQSNPFGDTWAQPSSMPAVSSHSPVSNCGVADSETPILSPAQVRVDSGAPSFAGESEHEQHQSAHEEATSSGDEEARVPSPTAGMSQPAAAQAPHSSSETSTPEELQDYDSSSGVESHSDKRQTPVPSSVQGDMEQDLGIHLEKGDGEEEEAETLPADEVLGMGPPTAPASAPSSPSTSGDEASDTEGEMQINDPDAPAGADERAGGFESPTPARSLPALDEDEEAGDAPAGEGEEDGGRTTPQSANSVASYGFDCTTSNSNAHSMAESCGKSPGIFSLENEEQLPEEAKDPSLIKELTLPSAAGAAFHAEELFGKPVDLVPLGHPDDNQPGSLDDDRYMLGGEMASDHLQEVDPLEPGSLLGGGVSGESADGQPPYYSTICDKTDSFLAGDEKTAEEQSHSREDNRNQNHTAAVPIANGHYLALVPGNRRPIDPTVAAHFAKMALPPPPPSPLIETNVGASGDQLRKLEQHQGKLREMQHRQEQERQKRQWLEEERLRLDQQKQLEKQRRELLQLQLQQQQQEHRHRRQVLQWQLELEQQYRMQQKQIQQQQQLRRSPTGVMLSPSSGLCTIYEAMETSDEEDESAEGGKNRNAQVAGKRGASSRGGAQDFQRQLRPVPPQELEWNRKVDMVQQLINQTLMLSGDGGCPPLLLLPVGTGGTLSPLESSMWPLLPQVRPPAATVTSVSSYSPDSRGSSPTGDWTVVEVETQH